MQPGRTASGKVDGRQGPQPHSPGKRKRQAETGPRPLQDGPDLPAPAASNQVFALAAFPCGPFMNTGWKTCMGAKKNVALPRVGIVLSFFFSFSFGKVREMEGDKISKSHVQKSAQLSCTLLRVQNCSAVSIQYIK